MNRRSFIGRMVGGAVAALGLARLIPSREALIFKESTAQGFNNFDAYSSRLDELSALYDPALSLRYAQSYEIPRYEIDEERVKFRRMMGFDEYLRRERAIT